MLARGKMNFVIDGQFGSTGKGLISSFLARQEGVRHVACCNLPNAGHTAVNGSGDAYISKALPVCGILKKWYGQNISLWVGPTAGFTINRFKHELKETTVSPMEVFVHPRTGVVNHRHTTEEANGATSTKHLASTMQGSGAMLAEKIMRGEDVKLARDYPEISTCINWSFVEDIHTILDNKEKFLFEGAQGFSLGINHGHSYPTCTSRECTAMQAAADLGINMYQMGEVIQVIRPFPIRVGNVIEEGVRLGYSGDWYEDSEETAFDVLGVPVEVTTVTKRPRRVASFSKIELKKSCAINGTTQIALNFANHIDKKCYGVSEKFALSASILKFIDMVEDTCQVPVNLVGTGPQIDHVVVRN